MVRVARFWLCVFCVVWGWSVGRAAAQDESTPAQAKPLAGKSEAGQREATATLHVYVNLIEIPVLVLSPGMLKVKPIAASRFSVSVDHGPLFRATDARLEGDEPISLAIFLDTGESQQDLLPKIDEAIAGLGRGSLGARDKVSVYAMHCSQLRFVTHVRAEPEDLKRAVKDALQIWTSRAGDKDRKLCAGAAELPHLRASLAYAVRKLYLEDGRRVMLAVTDGSDGRKGSWDAVSDLAGAAGVAIFGMRYVPGDRAWAGRWSAGPDDGFGLMCERTGGRVLPVYQWNAGKMMMQFVEEVRGRYIVEFPRPYRSGAGKHLLLVKIDKSMDFIRPAGISVPVADAARRADPMTIPEDPTQAPELGPQGLPDGSR